MQEESEIFFISEEEQGERLDKILAARFGKVGSRTYFQYLIEEHKVILNGAPVKKRIRPKAGDEIEIDYILTPELTLKPEELPLEILYEDEAILVVNKAPGMVVHPAPGHWSGTFVNALLYHCRIDGEGEGVRPGIVHRLDKDTSGVLIAAKSSLVQQRLIELFCNRKVYKEYLAICVGNPGQGVIEAPIGRHPVHRKMMAVVAEGGRFARTEYRTLAYDEALSLVSLVIATGRTHQIRVHMKHRGTPVLGDPVYGRTAGLKDGLRQMLHAYRVRLLHPLTGKEISFEAEVPADMLRLMKAHHFG